MGFNELPEGFEGEQKRETEFESPEEKLAYDTENLIVTARESLESSGVENASEDQVLMAIRLIVGAHRKDYNDVLDEAIRGSIDLQIKNEKAQKRELTPKQAQETLKTLESRFQRNTDLHKGVRFDDVKKSLEANPEALWSVAQMEAKGHEPDVYNDDDKGFDIGTCSKESPASAGNCVYDKEAADWLKENRPNEIFNGSAVEMAQEMGIDLMHPDLYENILQKKGKFDEQTRSWLLTHSSIRSDARAIDGSRRDGNVLVSLSHASARSDAGAFRGSLRVSWKV